MGYHIHRSDSLEVLADYLTHFISENPQADIFAPEYLLTSIPGMQRWLSQHLSCKFGITTGYTDGVCAGITFIHPKNFLNTFLIPQAYLWESSYLVWTILNVLNATTSQDRWNEVLHPDRDCWPKRRYRVAENLAQIFTHYLHARRLGMLRALLMASSKLFLMNFSGNPICGMPLAHTIHHFTMSHYYLSINKINYTIIRNTLMNYPNGYLSLVTQNSRLATGNY